MKFIITVLFLLIVMFVSGCGVSIDKGAGVIHTSGFLGDMRHGYTERSGLTITNPSTDLRMEAKYSVCMHLYRTAYAWRVLNPNSDPYPIVAVDGGEEKGLSGENVFIPATKLTNYKNILRVEVDFYRDDIWVGSDYTECWVSFYEGTWRSEWRPSPRA